MVSLTWQVLEGKDVIPITMLEAVDEVDAGDVFLEDEIALDGTELIDELRQKQASSTFDLCDRFLSNPIAISEMSQKQTGDSSYYARRRPSDSKLDLTSSLSKQFNLLRVVDSVGTQHISNSMAVSM